MAKAKDRSLYLDLIRFLRDGVPLPLPKGDYIAALENKLALTDKYLVAQNQRYYEKKQKDPLNTAILGALEDTRYLTVQEIVDKIPDEFSPTPLKVLHRLNKTLVPNGKAEFTTARIEGDNSNKREPVYRKKLPTVVNNYNL